MTQTKFISGRTGRGGAYVSDLSGAEHDKFMRATSYALMPLSLLAAWYVVSLSGKSFEAARAELAHPFPALALIAFIVVGMAHACVGAELIIIDYLHEPATKELALKINKWAAIAIAVLWTLAILLIAAPN